MLNRTGEREIACEVMKILQHSYNEDKNEQTQILIPSISFKNANKIVAMD